MGRPRGGTNRFWSKENKLRVIKQVMDGEISAIQLIRKEKISNSQYYKWVRAYEERGIDGLENKRKPGNPLSKFQNRKHLTELEQLQYDNMKLRIENSRLKKGYTTEEAMSIKQKRLSKKNTQ